VPGKVWADSYITQTDSYRASAFYNEWARPQGWDDFVEIGLLRAPDAFSCLVLMRSADAVWMEPKEWHLLETLAPHLKRAAEVHQLLARERAAKESLGAGIAAAGFAGFLLSKDYRVIFANAKAEELLRRGDGLRCVHGRLIAATTALTDRVAALARGAAGTKDGEGDIGGTIELPCCAGRPALIAHLFPVAAIHTASIFDIERPAAALFVIDPAANFEAKIERFAALHGLTAAETKCVAELVRGKGLPAAAARLKIGHSTARSHCQNIFFKTATTRQGELTRRFFETAI
jgi:DNA-binding CsgD family transcriptional regulator